MKNWIVSFGCWFLVLGCWLLVIGSWLMRDNRDFREKENAFYSLQMLPPKFPHQPATNNQ